MQESETTHKSEVSLFEKAKFAAMVLSIIIPMFVYWDLKSEIRHTTSDFTAWQAATQNVTNRFIGRLEGLGQKDTANIIKAMNEEIQEESHKKGSNKF
jgi:hypothetical protein